MLTSSGKGMMKQPFHLGALDSVELDLYIKQYCITGGHNWKYELCERENIEVWKLEHKRGIFLNNFNFVQ